MPSRYGRTRAVRVVRLSALASRSMRRPVAGVTSSLLLAATLSVVGLVAAGNAGAAVPAGYVAAPNWTVGATATTTLPGNAAAFGNVVATNNSVGQQVMESSPSGYTIDGVTVPRFYPTAASIASAGTACVQGKPVGQQNTCATYSETVTLPHPVVDPIISLAMGGGGNNDVPTTWCTGFWYDIAFASVNGTGPAAGVVTPVGATGNYVFASNQLSLPPSAIPTCSSPGGGAASYIQLHGLISSFTLNNIYRGEVTRNDNGSVVGAAGVGGVRFNVNTPSADLALTKTAPTLVASNGTINWTINVTNNGPADSHGFVVRDVLPAGVTNAALVSAPAGCSLSGSTLTCAEAPPGCTVAQNATVTTFADLTCSNPLSADETVLASGSSFGPIVLSATGPATPGTVVTNTATVSGVDGDPNTANNTATTTTTVQSPALTLTKTANPTTVTTAGQSITYSFVVTNTGNVALSNINITESSFTGTGPTPTATCPSPTLAIGATETCTATYTTTQADIDAGTIGNTAIAHGTGPGETTPTDSTPSTATATATPAPALTVVKSATPAAIATAGQTVTYSFVVTNTGNVTLTDVTVDEGTFTGTGTLSPVVCPAGAASLAPGGQVTCTATYVVTQADVDAGSVTNDATATGTPPTGPPVTSPPSTTTVDIPAQPAITVAKSATPATVTAVGQTVTYSFVVTNTGNVTLTDVTVDEGTFTGTGTLSPVVCPAGAASLAPGGQVTCTATYVVTQADVDAGSVTNTATAAGTPPTGSPITSPPASTTVALPKPALPLAFTGVHSGSQLLTGGIGLLLLGMLMLILSARRRCD